MHINEFTHVVYVHAVTTWSHPLPYNWYKVAGNTVDILNQRMRAFPDREDENVHTGRLFCIPVLKNSLVYTII